MFAEPLQSTVTASQKGWIEVVCGPMFSGKTEELIRRIRRAKIAKQRIELFKPKIDVRYDEINIVSHDSRGVQAIPVENAQTILLMVGDDINVVGIDEAQFFDNALTEVCQTLADKGIRVIVAGLDRDFTGNPFGPMPHIMAAAEYVTKIHAICIECGDLASFSYRISESKTQVMLGEKENYIPLCRTCYNKNKNK